jgi:hypothetical protein
MADRGTYVDIFFRNGLKEFEVLPPHDIWDNIKPVIGKRHRRLTLYRIAATVSILVSVSALSYWFTREISKDFNGPALSLNQEITPDGNYIADNKILNTDFSDNSVIAGSVPEEIVPDQNATSREEPTLKFSSDALFDTRVSNNGLMKVTVPRTPAGGVNKVSGFSTIEGLNLTPEISVTSSEINVLNRWSISAMASPTYFSSVSPGNNESSSDLIKSEKAAVSYSGGLSFSYNINKRVTIQSGLYYSSLGQEVTGMSSYVGFHDYADAKSGSGFGIQTSNGVIVSSNNDIFFQDNISARVISKYTSAQFDPVKADLAYLNNSLIQNFNFVELPVFFRFKAIDRKLDLNFIGGISYNMLVGNSSFTYENGVKYVIGKTEGLNPINFSSSLGLGFEYNISGKISLNLEPTVRYYLTPIGGMIGTSIHPYSLGIFSGLSYKF